MRTLIVAAIALAGVTACATKPDPKWVKPGSTQQSFSQDRFECLQQSRLAVPVYNTTGPVTTDNNLFSACMGARGWQWK